MTKNLPTTPALSVIIPAYNEQESLEATVKAVVAALPDPPGSQLVIVNDGSTDETLSIAQAIAASSPAMVVVVDRAANGGMGQALASGLERATGDVITWIPGDGEYDLGEVLAGLKIDETRARKLVTLLLRDKTLVKISDDLVFHREALDGLRALLLARKFQSTKDQPAKLDVAAFKDMTGVSRKYAIPLLEYLDREQVTRRVENKRIIL